MVFLLYFWLCNLLHSTLILFCSFGMTDKKLFGVENVNFACKFDEFQSKLQISNVTFKNKKISHVKHG
ncbi:hypothetical protein EXE23_15075 [Acinetobacter venetianus]|nr:hypothetical protein EXE23_15075 [Acinetobacter venetianus]